MEQISTKFESLVQATVKFGSILSPLSLAVGFGAINTVLHVLHVPRIGLGRAWTVGLRSIWNSLWLPKTSQRTALVSKVRDDIRHIEAEQYIVVTGPKGVGKSLLVETAVRWRPGVVTVRVPAGAAEREITNEAFAKFANLPISPSSAFSESSAIRVLKVHKLLFGKATLVLQVAERDMNKQYAEVTAAARILATLPLRVVIDASHNSLPSSAAETKREILVEVFPMERQQIEAMDELQELLAVLRAADLQDLVWEVLGGSPADYLQLKTAWGSARKTNIEDVVALFVESRLDSAIDRRNSCELSVGGNYASLLQRFQQEDAVPKSAFTQLPSPDKVLRAVRGKVGSSRLLVPVDATMKLVLRYDLRVIPSLSELKQLLKTTPQRGST